MRHKLLAEDIDERSVILALDKGDEAFKDVSNFAKRAGAAVQSIAASEPFRGPTVAFFELGTRNGTTIPVEAQSEVLA